MKLKLMINETEAYFKSEKWFNSEDMIKLYPDLPTTVTTFNFRASHIKCDPETLAIALNAMPKTINTIKLTYNKDWRWDPVSNFIKIVKSIPATVTTIDFGNNSDTYSFDLAQVLPAIPKTVKTLSLKNIELGTTGTAKIKKILSSIPATVTILDLSDNQFEIWGGETLNELLSCISLSVTSIKLRDKFFVDKSSSSRDFFLTGIKPTVQQRQLDLTNSMDFLQTR